MERPPEKFFPTFDRLRSTMGELRLPTQNPVDTEIDLLGLEPAVIANCAAVIALSRMIVRQDWSETVEIANATFDAIDTVAPATPRSDDPNRFAKREYRYRAHDARRQTCTMCPINKGQVLCAVCHGEGTMKRTRNGNLVEVPCDLCVKGWSKCLQCDGSGQSVVVEVHQGTDSVLEARNVVVPSLVGDLDDKIGARINTLADPSDAFRIDLESSVQMSAYRGAVSGTTNATFFDYGFHDAKDRARALLPPSPESTIYREDSFWAWPFLCVRWKLKHLDIDVGVVPDLAGNWSPVFAGPPLRVTPSQ